MKTIKSIALGLATVGMSLFSSCEDDYLDTVPSTSVSESTMTTLDNLYLALNGIHKEMVSQESGYQCLGGEPGFMMCRDVEADDITWITNTWMKSAYLGWQCNMNETSGYNSSFWRIYYQWILNANKILESLESIDATEDEALYNQIKGETLCIRGWAHFNLVQLYAERYDATQENTQDGIPYRVEPTTDEMARNSVEEVYSKINEDLDNACVLLEGIEVADVNHYSEMVAWGLKARVALAMQDYSNAATYAAKSIELAEEEGCSLMTGDELYCGFADITSDTNEAMYAAMTADDMTVYYYSYYAYMSWNFNSTAIRQGVKCINADTYETMSETDLRREWWDPTGEESVPTTSYVQNPYQNRKFTARSTSNAVGDVAFMRLAEMYLTEAEALARAGDYTEAQTVFNEFQVTRDPSYVGGSTGDQLIEEIMNSRRVELWGEGFRFYDLKRLHLPIERGSNFSISFCTFLEKDEDANGWVWEIPQIETDYNTLCTKNY